MQEDHHSSYSLCFFSNPPSTTQIYTLSLHDALPISPSASTDASVCASSRASESTSTLRFCCPITSTRASTVRACSVDRKSTRLNSSHSQISYAVFCLKKKTDPVFSIYNIPDTLLNH